MQKNLKRNATKNSSVSKKNSKKKKKKVEKKHRPLLFITIELEDVADEMEELVEKFSQLRFELLDRAEKLKDETAKEYYEGWTRRMHLHLGNAMEVDRDDNTLTEDDYGA